MKQLLKHFDHLKVFLAVLFPSLIVLEISAYTNPIFSAGFIGLVFSLLFHRYAPEIYCGAFIGMSSSTILESYFSVVLASVSAFCLLFLRHRIPIHGGKLGMIAFISVLLVNLPEVIEGEIEIISQNLFLTGEMVAILITFSMLSLYLTYYLRTVLQKRFSHDSVIASAIIGIIFGFFSILVPETLMIGEVAYASSFAGMGRIKIIKEKFLLVSVIVAAIYILALPVFKGFGGKLGSIAFVSMLLVYILHGKGELFE